MWETDLEKGSQIGESRIVVMVAPTQDEIRAGQLETRTIPPDVELPDP